MELPTESEVAREFGKQEVLAVCRELEIEVDDGEHVYALVDLIWKDLDESGVPVPEDVSDLLWQFLDFCGYYDEQGNIVEDSVDQERDPADKIAELLEDREEPGCLGWGEPEYNPNCKRCPLKEICVQMRERNMAEMSCAYVLYDPENEECKKCSVWRSCKDGMEARQG